MRRQGRYLIRSPQAGAPAIGGGPGESTRTAIPTEMGATTASAANPATKTFGFLHHAGRPVIGWLVDRQRPR